jgi:hypothetical protein
MTPFCWYLEKRKVAFSRNERFIWDESTYSALGEPGVPLFTLSQLEEVRKSALEEAIESVTRVPYECSPTTEDQRIILYRVCDRLRALARKEEALGKGEK